MLCSVRCLVLFFSLSDVVLAWENRIVVRLTSQKRRLCESAECDGNERYDWRFAAVMELAVRAPHLFSYPFLLYKKIQTKKRKREIS